MSRRRNAITDQFVPHTRGMLDSPAYRVLSKAAFLVLSRIELEHMNHGGKENGNLPVTYDNFVKYGIHRHSIAPAIRELAALGFIELTERGCAGNREYRSPNKYRLTYCPAKNAHGNGTHEWRFVKSLEQADEIARRARKNIGEANISVSRRRRTTAASKKQNASDGKRQPSVSKTVTDDPSFPVTETVTTAPMMDSGTTLNILGGVGGNPSAEGQRSDRRDVRRDALPCRAYGGGR
jgi:hypothetical protein